jgi:hypothetical protein
MLIFFPVLLLDASINSAQVKRTKPRIAIGARPRCAGSDSYRNVILRHRLESRDLESLIAFSKDL